MRAAMITAPNIVEVRDDVPRPAPGPGQALVAIRATGLCGTDLTILSGDHPRARWPLVPGHEVLAEVIELVPQHAAGHLLQPGQRVVVNPLLSCGSCAACKRGRPQICEHLRLLGIDAPGGLAEYMVVNAEHLLPVPQGTSDTAAALTEPLAVAVRALRRGCLSAGEHVVVLGAGPIGLLVGLLAQQTGAARVVLLDIRLGRVALAQGLGLEALTVDVSGSDMPTGFARGFDVVFECSGNQASVGFALALACSGGRIVVVGAPHEPSQIHLREVNFRELSLVGTRVYAEQDIAGALAMLPPLTSRLEQLVSHLVPLKDAPVAFDIALSDPQAVKVLVVPGDLRRERRSG